MIALWMIASCRYRVRKLQAAAGPNAIYPENRIEQINNKLSRLSLLPFRPEVAPKVEELIQQIRTLLK